MVCLEISRHNEWMYNLNCVTLLFVCSFLSRYWSDVMNTSCHLLFACIRTQIAPRRVTSRHRMLFRSRCGQTRLDVVQDVYEALISSVEVVTNSIKNHDDTSVCRLSEIISPSLQTGSSHQFRRLLQRVVNQLIDNYLSILYFSFLHIRKWSNNSVICRVTSNFRFHWFLDLLISNGELISKCYPQIGWITIIVHNDITLIRFLSGLCLSHGNYIHHVDRIAQDAWDVSFAIRMNFASSEVQPLH